MFEHFYYEAIRKTVVAFGTLFNNIFIKHKNKQGDIVSTVKVPFAYGPTQKFLARLEQSPNLNKPIQITTPRMSMEIVGLSYDPARKGTATKSFVARDGDNKTRKSYLPVPYNVNFELSIFTKLEDDMFQIVEQIIPYFQPHYTITITVIDEIQEKRDIKFTLDNISMTDNYEGNFEERRALIWTLRFTAKTYMFLPLSGSGDTESNIINKVSIGFIAGSSSNSISSDININVSPRATKNYTGTVVTTLSKDVSVNDKYIYVSDPNNINTSSFVVINNETLYVESKNNDALKVTRALFGTTAQLHVSGSDVLNITTIDNSLLQIGDPFGFISIFE